MGSPIGVISEKDAKALGRKQRAALKKKAQQLLRTDPQIRKILKAKLNPTFKRLKAKGSK
jgi:hypothetical protein